MTERAHRLVRVADEGAVRTITLARPERKNALTPGLVNELLYALDDAKEAASVRVVVLTGAGDAFCAGADLRGGADEEALPPRGDYADLLLRFPKLGKPTIAYVNGVAMGGGLGLVASADFAIAKQSATFGTPEIKRGLFPMQIMAVLRRVTSKRRLLEMMLLGESFDAAFAERIELVSRAVPDEQAAGEVDTLAKKLAAQSPTAMRLGLAAYDAQLGLDLAEAIPYLRDQFIALFSTEDAAEGLRAFAEKRAPQFTGR